jgi:hypothetical protein
MDTSRLPVHVRGAWDVQFTRLCTSVLLTESDLEWRLQQRPDYAPRGNTWVLDTESKTRSVRFELLTRSFHERARRLLQELGITVTAGNLAAQCFATRMIGSNGAAPYILPHIDSCSVQGREARPFVSCVYYVVVNACRGGEFQVHSHATATEVSWRVQPAEGDLILISGNVTHSVAPLLSGERVSLVMNLYYLSAQ